MEGKTLTPIEELISNCTEYKDMFKNNDRKSIEIRRTYQNVIMIAEKLLQKEKEAIIEAYNDGMDYNADLLSSQYKKLPINGEHYYNTKYNNR